MAVRVAVATDADELATVAAQTFPLACPPMLGEADIAAFIDEHFTPARFAEYLADPQRIVLAAVDDERIVGYAMLIRGATDDPDVQRAVPARPALEVSKMYVLPVHHGAGLAAALMREAVATAERLGCRCVWLGVNEHNLRAQRFYAKHGFVANGNKTFRVGSSVENDFVMVRGCS